MYLMYVDESGDIGLNNSPTQYFILSGLIIHELYWKECLNKIIELRKKFKHKFGLHLRDEIHASAMINHPGSLVRIKRNDRLTILREFAEKLASLPEFNIINIVVRKQNKSSEYDVFENAWKTLIQRFENTISYKNFPSPSLVEKESGIIFPDHTHSKKLKELLRKMRHYNPVPHQKNYASTGFRNMAINTIVEDPNFRDSADSYFIQAADIIAFLLYQKYAPNSYIKKKSGQNYFRKLEPILCRHVSNSKNGIVEL